jgi:catechol 2,3-dioxygenase-like lactoylglutathione lyase family enzyme
MNYYVEHFGLAARQPTALKDWYVNVLEAECIFDNQETPPAFLLKLPGGVLLEIYPAQSDHPEASDNLLSGWRHVALQVDSIEEAKTALTGKGVAFEEPIKPAGGGGRVLFFKDSESNLLHLVERSSQSPFRSLSR